MTRWIEMAAWLIAATIGSRALPPRAALRATSRVAERIAPTGRVAADERLSADAHAIASSLASRLPIANCLDEAIAARLWLARRGVRADVVVGMRRADGGWDGHAWFEHGGVSYGAGELSHKVVFRESELVS